VAEELNAQADALRQAIVELERMMSGGAGQTKTDDSEAPPPAVAKTARARAAQIAKVPLTPNPDADLVKVRRAKKSKQPDCGPFV